MSEGPIDLLVALREAIARTREVPVEAVHADSSLEELGIDSLDAAEIITDVEIRTGLELPIDVLRRLAEVRTVADVLARLERVRSQTQADGFGLG
jgi:acyl carrier protein